MVSAFLGRELASGLLGYEVAECGLSTFKFATGVIGRYPIGDFLVVAGLGHFINTLLCVGCKVIVFSPT